MSIEDLKSILGENKLSYSTISFAEMANIMAYVGVKLQMDRHTLDYYYEIDVGDLLKSNITKDELDTLKKQGWAFNDNNEKIILYINT